MNAMKNVYFFWMLLSVLTYMSCTKENELEEVDLLPVDYVLPQGGSSADDRIVECHEKWGTYILYDYTDLDYRYAFVANSVPPTYEMPDVEYVDEMMDLLELTWFDFYSTEFHKKYMPYVILLTSTMETGIYNLYSYMDKPTHFFIKGCSNALDTITLKGKRGFKNEVQVKLWESWYNNGKIEVPDEFFKVSDYSTASSEDPASDNYARKRGFLYYESKMYEWSAYISPYGGGFENTDLLTYLHDMLRHSEEEWAENLKYPLVKQKYDILRNYIIEEYGIDLQEIGNALCK